jgi:hypothetical protein
MKRVLKITATIPSLLSALALAWLGLSSASNALGVVPPPDGGYPGFNTAEGQNALFNLTSGSGNTGVGWYSLFSATTASFNTGLGAGALALNTADENTAIGAATLLFNTAGGNTAVGSRALLNNTTGGTLTNIAGFDVGPNVAVGAQTLENNTLASANTAMGYQALHSFTAGPTGAEQLGLCTAVGFQALANTTSGFANSALGYQALINNTEGSSNTAAGAVALSNNTTGDDNTAIGTGALSGNTTGDDNTAIAGGALNSNTTGNQNTAVGVNALDSNDSGTANTGLGSFAGSNITSGIGNTVLGVAAGNSITTANNVICIGTAGQNENNSCYIGNIYGATSPGTAVLIDINGKLGTVTSSKRFKEDIKPMGEASEALLALKPVSFHYKKDVDPTGRSQFGLIAEEVEQLNPDLVMHDKDGKPYTVRYEQVNAMLLNEFLKDHKRVEQQQVTIAQLTKQVEMLVAHAKEQDSKIQNVSAQLELSRPVAQFTSISH